ncbi:hypothetical protein FRD01_14585 [Microvenator marinus]|uniref:Uncharacterized protein n=1 Tax=Microvenator marinus TaxID=2600177 RepID=A0A5B8XYD1_9DELT|nr:hypothetical protein [Microvenator marinus]QED28439.1 hypothetical protein FRD01_14585 [Microvenator marinus]
MNIDFKSFIGVLIFLCFLAPNSWAQEQAVEVEAVGASFREATVNAQRSAVEQAVGTLISSDTLVIDGGLIRDEILLYSSGYIQTWETISKERLGDGSFRVKIRALVATSRLSDKLVQLKVSGETSGKDIMTELRTKQERGKQSRMLVAKALRPFLNADCVKADIVAQRVVVDKDLKGRIHFEGLVEIDQVCYQQARANLVNVLSKVGVKYAKQVVAEKTKTDGYFFPTRWPSPCRKRRTCDSYMIAVQASHNSSPANFDIYELHPSAIDMEMIAEGLEGSVNYYKFSVVNVRFDWYDSDGGLVLSKQLSIGNEDSQIDQFENGTLILMSWVKNPTGNWPTLEQKERFELVVEETEALETATKYDVTVSTKLGIQTIKEPSLPKRAEEPETETPANRRTREWSKRPNWSDR